jgi:hypothetical protein
MGARSMARDRKTGIKIFFKYEGTNREVQFSPEKNRRNYFFSFMRRKYTARAFDTE